MVHCLRFELELKLEKRTDALSNHLSLRGKDFENNIKLLSDRLNSVEQE